MVSNRQEGEVSDVLGKIVDSVASKSGAGHSYISNHRNPASVGMESYWNVTVPGIGGDFKQRFTDFIVHEVTKEGKVIELTKNNKAPLAPWLAGGDDLKVDNADQEKLKKCLGETVYDNADQVSKGDMDSFEFVAQDDKEDRKQQHLAIKVLWSNLNAETFTQPDDSKVIKLVLKGNKGRGSKKEIRWPGDSRYCHFTLYKEQLDTAAALNYLARCIHVPVKTFQFAGMKDKRGSTTQRISADRMTADRILGVIKAYNNQISALAVSDFSYESRPLKLGDLAGNHFQVVLRNISANEADINLACEAVKKYGFANYFGTQRFGTGKSFSTADIGRLLLQCKWQEAVDAILKSYIETRTEDGDERVKQFEEAWFVKRNADEAAKFLPGPYRLAERMMLHTLEKNPSDLIGAIRKIPRGTVLMFGHAYQSLLWNKTVARRIKEFGNTQVLVGDLVASEEDTGINSNELDDAADCEDEEFSKGETSVKPITSTDGIDITQVVMPLPGFDVLFPNNEMEKWYKEMLEVLIQSLLYILYPNTFTFNRKIVSNSRNVASKCLS